VLNGSIWWLNKYVVVSSFKGKSKLFFEAELLNSVFANKKSIVPKRIVFAAIFDLGLLHRTEGTALFH
jgi:hypothetical protein